MKEQFFSFSLPNIITFMRFAVVGTYTAVLYYFCTVILNEKYGLNLIFSSTTALIIAVIFQYISHAAFTFRKKLIIQDQIKKFFITVSSGSIISTTAIFSASHTGISRETAILIIMLTTPIVNWLVFSRWVFVDAGDD